jgi:transposase
VRRNLLRLSDEQWKRIEPHLPTNMHGVERADDRRVISGTRYDRLAESTWLQSALLPLSYGGFNEPGPLVTGIAQW